jgi:type IV secretory pathway VirB2 component (pilin)
MNTFTKRKDLKLKMLALLCLALGFVTLVAPFVYADIGTGQEQKVVSDFADFIINILTGPVSKILGAVLLIAGVIALLNGKQGVAIACGFGFMILMFIPKILEGLFKQ